MDVNKRIEEILDGNRQRRRIRFKNQVLFWLAIIACVGLIIGAQFGIAASTSAPTSRPAFGRLQAEQVTDAELQASGAALGLPLTERRAIEDELIALHQQPRFVWPQWGINSTEGLPYDIFIQEINRQGFPYNWLMSEIIQVHDTTSSMRDTATVAAEVTGELYGAYLDIRRLPETGLPSWKEFLDTRGRRYFAHLAIMLFTLWVLLYGTGNVAGTINAAIHSEEERARLERLMAAQQAWSESIAFQSGQQHLQVMAAADRQQAITLMGTITIMNQSQAQRYLAGLQNQGLIADSVVAMLIPAIEQLAIEDASAAAPALGNSGLLQFPAGFNAAPRVNSSTFPRGSSSALDSLSGYGSDEDAMNGGNKRKGKRSKSSQYKKQRGGAGTYIPTNFTEDAFDSFMGFLIKNAPSVAIFFATLMSEIEYNLIDLYLNPGNNNAMMDDWLYKYVIDERSDVEKGYASPVDVTRPGISQGYGGRVHRKISTKRNMKKKRNSYKRKRTAKKRRQSRRHR
jgi:hypothetical protein